MASPTREPPLAYSTSRIISISIHCWLGKPPMPTADRGVSPTFSIKLRQQVSRPVGDQRLLAEVRCRVDHAQQLGHPLHPVQITDGHLHIRQAVQTGLPRAAS